MASTTRIVAGALVVLLAAAAGGYYFLGNRGAAPAPQKADAPPPPDVGVIEVKRADVPLTLNYAGRVAGFRTVEIRSMVSGTIWASFGSRVFDWKTLPGRYEVSPMQMGALSTLPGVIEVIEM